MLPRQNRAIPLVWPINDNFKQTAYGEAIIATIINASYDIIDLTSSAYPATCLKIMEKLEKGITANIYIKERAELPQQSIIQVQKADGGYQLFTGIFETSEEDGTIKNLPNLLSGK